MKRVHIALFIGLLELAACKKGDPEIKTATPTLLQQIDKESDLSLFKAALTRIRIDTVFSDGGPYTVFAPVDSAMTRAGLTLENINNLDVDSLKSILDYHIIIGRIGSATLPGFLRKKFVSLHPTGRPFIVKNYYGIFIDGVHVGEGNIGCADGTLHKIDRVCFPPPGDLYTVIMRQPNLSFMAEIARANVPMVDRNIGFILHVQPDSLYYAENWFDPGPNGVKPFYTDFTLLLPTDQAFLDKGLTLDSIRTLIARQPDQIGNLLVATVLCGHYFTGDFQGEGGFLINRPNIGAGPVPDGYTYFFIGASGIGIVDRAVYQGYLGAPFPPTLAGHIVQPDLAATNGAVQVLDVLIKF